MIFFLILIFISLFPLHVSSAQLYKWTDQKGSVHFTDNYQGVPPEYRDQVEVGKMVDRKKKVIKEKVPVEKIEPEEKKEKEPLPEGEIIFNEKCVKCHSLAGKNPMKNATRLTGLLNRKRFNEHILPVTEENIIKITIKGGWDDMPAFPELEGEGINKLMEFLNPYLTKKED